MPPPKYKTCKNCGNRNHPGSRQCPWCGAALPSSMDWFSRLCLLFIVLVLVGLFVYAHKMRTPSPGKARLPAATGAVAEQAAPAAEESADADAPADAAAGAEAAE